MKVNWEGKRGFVTRKPGAALEKKPKFSTLDNAKLIELVFADRIITDSKHEAVIRNWNGS